MGSRCQFLRDDLVDFIWEQKMFSVGTAANGGTINVSLKGWDSLRAMATLRTIGKRKAP